MRAAPARQGDEAGPLLRIDRLDRSGAGLAGERRVPFALPGERVRPAAGDDPFPEVVEPSPDRIAPACPHFGRCGGCVLQHAPDGFIARWKTEVVERALKARGLGAPVALTHISPPGARRRVVFGGRRTRKGGVVGFFAAGTSTLVPVETCPVARPEIVAALPALARLAALGASRSRPVRLAVTASEGGLDVAVTEARPLDRALAGHLAAHAAEHDFARLAWNGAVVAQRRPPWQSLGPAHVLPPPGAFLQATAEATAALTAAVERAAGRARRVADLFAGIGTFALPLARTREVHAVESDADALAALVAGWRDAPGLRRLTAERRDLERRPLLPGELARFDAVVIDPPRAGAAAQARMLARSGVPRVVAVSCEPASCARDLALLVAGGYRLDRVEVIDQFRWSPHVELVACLSRDT